jgi:hypothetical protein
MPNKYDSIGRDKSSFHSRKGVKKPTTFSLLFYCIQERSILNKTLLNSRLFYLRAVKDIMGIESVVVF